MTVCFDGHRQDYNPGMQLVIPGALPATAVAGELARHLPEHAPTLNQWLTQGQARVQAFDVHAQGCTAYEGWQVRAAGFVPQPPQTLGAGLGPLLGGVQGESPVWVADLVHLALGMDSANLLDPDLLCLQPDEGAALLEAARELLADGGFEAQELSPRRWRLSLPPGLQPDTASPAAVIGERLQHWWALDPASRPWRRLLNDIQMAWYAHPVNEARSERGLPPINGLWLYGGARPWTLQALPPVLAPELDTLARAGDWGGWLAALARLDRDHLRPLARPDGQPMQALQLLLLGRERQADVTLNPRTGLRKWLPAPKTDWKRWWSSPV